MGETPSDGGRSEGSKKPKSAEAKKDSKKPEEKKPKKAPIILRAEDPPPLIGTAPMGGECGSVSDLRQTRGARFKADQAAAKDAPKEAAPKAASKAAASSASSVGSGGSSPKKAPKTKRAEKPGREDRPWRVHGDAPGSVEVAYPEEIAGAFHTEDNVPCEPGQPEAECASAMVGKIAAGFQGVCWDKLRKEFAVQCMIWESMHMGPGGTAKAATKGAQTLAIDLPEGQLQAEMNSLLEDADSGRTERAMRKLESTLDRDAADNKLLGKAAVQMAHDALKAEWMSLMRKRLAAALLIVGKVMAPEDAKSQGDSPAHRRKPPNEVAMRQLGALLAEVRRSYVQAARWDPELASEVAASAGDDMAEAAPFDGTWLFGKFSCAVSGKAVVANTSRGEFAVESETTCTYTEEGVKYQGQLEGDKVKWSDGDVWKRKPRPGRPARKGDGDITAETLGSLLSHCEISDPKIVYCVRRALAWVLWEPGAPEPPALLSVALPTPGGRDEMAGAQEDGGSGSGSVASNDAADHGAGGAGDKKKDDDEDKKESRGPRKLDLSSLRVKSAAELAAMAPKEAEADVKVNDDAQKRGRAAASSPAASCVAEPPPNAGAPMWAKHPVNAESLALLGAPVARSPRTKPADFEGWWELGKFSCVVRDRVVVRQPPQGQFFILTASTCSYVESSVTYTGTLDGDAITWSDGDVWKRAPKDRQVGLYEGTWELGKFTCVVNGDNVTVTQPPRGIFTVMTDALCTYMENSETFNGKLKGDRITWNDGDVWKRAKGKKVNPKAAKSGATAEEVGSPKAGTTPSTADPDAVTATSSVPSSRHSGGSGEGRKRVFIPL